MEMLCSFVEGMGFALTVCANLITINSDREQCLWGI